MAVEYGAAQTFDEIRVPTVEELDSNAYPDAASVRLVITQLKDACKRLHDAQAHERTVLFDQNQTLRQRITKPRGEPATSLSAEDQKKVQIKPDRYLGPRTESFTSWSKSFSNLMQINGWSDALGIRLGYQAMHGMAREHVTHLNPDYDFKSTNDFLEQMAEIFDSPAQSEVAKMEFDKICQNVD